MGNLDGIDTIVIAMMENRSFDHLLGFLSHESYPDRRSDVDGLHQYNPGFSWDNADGEGNLYGPTATPDGYLPCDLPHSRDEVALQVNHDNMTGFIKAYYKLQQIDKTPVPMRFCRPEDIPITAALARHYRVCDRWHASLPDDTFPNRLMALCGTTFIDSTSVVKPPLHLLPDQHTIFDWLADKGKKFSIYVDAAPVANVGPPTNLLLMRSQWKHLPQAHTLDVLEATWKTSAPAPSVIYCEPFYNDFAIAIGMHGNCNHPPLPVGFGEHFLRRVYQALTSNPAKWKRTMLVICYDEHGGFFDHVVPPPMPYQEPAGGQWLNKAGFTTLGIRVPGIVVSPLVSAASAYHGLLDHTSILQLMVDKFGSAADLAYFGDAAARKANGVHSLADALDLATPRNDFIQLPDAPSPGGSSATTPALNDVSKLFRAVMAEKPVPTP